LLTGTYSLTF
jgi:NAD(P)-dependent dehydrogenase (short-subunit alcohol dehydrogenase family)